MNARAPFALAGSLAGFLLTAIAGIAGVAVAGNAEQGCRPAVELTTMAPNGTVGQLCGRVHCSDPASYGIATYIFVEGAGWWTKPSFDQAVVPIGLDSTWCADIVTGGSDAYATQVHVALVPAGSNPPQCAGTCELPSLAGYAVAEADSTRPPRIVSFAGYEWAVKASAGPVGPGPTRFSDSPGSVWTDAEGLHLKLRRSGSTWYGAEVVLQSHLGYGCYSFELSGPLGRLDPNVVLGFYTWDNALCSTHREIDIEFWRSTQDPLNAQYVVQPWSTKGNLLRWPMPRRTGRSQHLICWQQVGIRFESTGLSPDGPASQLLQSWTYVGPDVPDPGTEAFRMNLWLQRGDAHPPTDGHEVEIVVHSFAKTDSGVPGREFR